MFEISKIEDTSNIEEHTCQRSETQMDPPNLEEVLDLNPPNLKEALDLNPPNLEEALNLNPPNLEEVLD
jgi:hypothetical protein